MMSAFNVNPRREIDCTNYRSMETRMSSSAIWNIGFEQETNIYRIISPINATKENRIIEVDDDNEKCIR